MRIRHFRDACSGPVLHVRLRLARGCARRWHLVLAQRILDQGHTVSVQWSDSGGPLPRSLALLTWVEQSIYSSNARGQADYSAGIAYSAFASFNAESEPDVIVNLTGKPGDSGTGDELVPVFGEAWNERGIVAALVENRSPVVGWARMPDGAVLSTGTAAIAAPHILSQCLSQALALTVDLFARALARRSSHGASCTALGPRLITSVQSPSLVAHGVRSLTNRLTGRINALLGGAAGQWNIAWRAARTGRGIVETGQLDLEGFRWLARDPARYFADPFPVGNKDRTFLFCEEFPYALGYGILSVFEIGDDGTVSPPRPVLDPGYHVSYPCIFEHDGIFWMIPETAAGRTLDLYRAEDFPDRWVLHATLAAGCSFADATFFRHDGRCWIAATVPAEGQSDRDTLSLFYADRPEGEWFAHPGNPVVADVASARSAGWLVPCADGLRRPAQDCTGGYGWGLTIARIDRLTTEDYAETVVARLKPPAEIRARGLHTVNSGGGIETIDAIVP